MDDVCAVCGGDGRMSNTFGRTTTCAGCHGSGRKSLEPSGMRDVTKTKPSHHKPVAKGPAVEKETGPTTFEGVQLAKEVGAATSVSNETKAKLVREIAEYEGTHGRLTSTFTKKVKKQIRPIPG